jgi:hypothetical protein
MFVGHITLFRTDVSRITLAVLLAMMHAVLATTATVEKSMTSDEIAHLAAGETYNSRGDFRLQPENGNLPQRLAGLPMAVAEVPHPPANSHAWQAADIWNYGHALFYEQPVLVDQWLFLGRAMIALVSGATAMLVFFWSRALFGWRGGFLSLLLFVFCPTFLSHGALATSDVVMTFFFVASVGAWWRHLEKPGAFWAGISSVTLGGALLAKFSSVLLAPMLALIGLVWALGEIRRAGWKAPARRLAFSLALHVVVAWAVVWLGYGFRYSAFAPELAAGADFNNGWGWTLTGIGTPAKIIWWLKEWRVLPEAWLYGLTFVLNFARARGAFMSGEYSITGWVTFFPFAFLIKTTLPLLVLLAGGFIAAAISTIRRTMNSGLSPALARLRPLLPLAVLFVIYWMTSLSSNLNIGHRHILPTYPVLFIAAGWLGRWLDLRHPLAAAGILGAMLWHAGEAVAVRPHYLAYFNQIVGGPQNGWRHLVDSSLDWGQDLPRLKRWLDASAKGERVFLSYFGTGDATYEGIRATALPTLPIVGPPRRWHALAPGCYAISATMLQHVYSSIRGPWTIELEKEYQQLRLREQTLLSYQNDPTQRARLQSEAPAENWEIAWKRFELLRFARLCHYLRAKTPDAMIGFSILVYRVSGDELTKATGDSLQAWSSAIEDAVRQRGNTEGRRS